MTAPRKPFLSARLVTLCGAIGLVLIGGCELLPTQPIDGFCCLELTEESCLQPGLGTWDPEITPCMDPEAPFCDDTGEYSGLKHTCIPDPLGTPCDTPEDCAPERPFCIDRTCAQCDGDDTCPAAQPVCAEDVHLCEFCSDDGPCLDRVDTPRCLLETGACVGCVDAATDCAAPTAPICDETTHACRGCVDGECASNVCNTGTGACVDELDVIYIAPGGVAGSCTQAAPCATFEQALDRVAGSRNVIKAAPGTYTGQILLNAVTVTILGKGATVRPQFADESVVEVQNGAQVTIVGLTISGAGGSGTVLGLRSASPTALVRLLGATVTGNDGGGVSISGGSFSLTNNWIVGNGSGTSAIGGVQIGNITTAGLHELAFNTVTANAGASGTATGVACNSVGPVVLTFSSNIVYGNLTAGAGTQVAGANCAWTYSDVGPQPASGDGNLNIDPQFVDGISDFHLRSGSPCIDVADPAATVTVDIDGDSRPAGVRSDIGADEVPQE